MGFHIYLPFNSTENCLENIAFTVYSISFACNQRRNNVTCKLSFKQCQKTPKKLLLIQVQNQFILKSILDYEYKEPTEDELDFIDDNQGRNYFPTLHFNCNN